MQVTDKTIRQLSARFRGLLCGPNGAAGRVYLFASEVVRSELLASARKNRRLEPVY
jgi:hypothetical protein